MFDLDLDSYSSNKNFIEVVLTGGPSAGKSTSLPHVIEYFSQRDVRVITAPELATTIMTGGFSDLHSFRTANPLLYNQVQGEMVLMQKSNREHYQRLAEALAPEKVIILYDRAECDCRAYMDEDAFQAVLQENHLNMEQVRDSYDLVIHMVTAADGAEQHYDSEGNPARVETIDQAVAADRRTLKSWLGHPHLRVVDNSTDFQGKLNRVLEHINHSLAAIGYGDGRSIEIERKFLLEEPPDLTQDPLIDAKAISVEQTYLQTEKPGEEARIRKWADGEQVSFFWTRKRDLKERGGREEKEARIKPSEYVHLLQFADPERQPIRKTRYCFVHDGRHCELDRIIRNSGEPLWILEVELTSVDEEFEPPESLKIAKEVTDLPEYNNASLAAREEEEKNSEEK